GNYCFFNLLTIALCLLLIDDSTWRRQRGALQTNGGTRAVVSHYFADRLSIYAAAVVIVLTLPLNARLIYGAFKPEAKWPRLLGSTEPVVSSNGDLFVAWRTGSYCAVRTESVSTKSTALCSRDSLSLPFYDDAGTSRNRRVVETL